MRLTRLRWRLARPLAVARRLAGSLVPTVATAAAPATCTAAAAPAPIWRLPKRIDLPLDEIAIVLAVGVTTAQLQRSVICLESIRPSLYRLLRSGFLELLTRAIERIAQVVVGILLIRETFCIARRCGIDRLFECLRCLGKLPGSIRGSSGVVLYERCPGICSQADGIGLIGAPGAQRNNHQPQSHRQGDRGSHCRRPSTPQAARAHYQAGQQHHQGGGEGPLIALCVDLPLSIDQIMLRHRAEYRSQKSVEILTLAAQMHVGATRGGGDRLQPGLVETRFHQGARLVLDETASQIRR